jgi:uncharacterized protein YdaU (DUF1376 family)
MHHYPFHVKDYVLATAHLSNIEDLTYRRLLDLYYTSEAPIPNDPAKLSRRLRVDDVQVVTDMLEEFFTLLDDGCWHKTRCDEEIGKYKGFAEAGKRGAEKRWAKGDDSPPNSPPTATPMPTKNQEPEPRNKVKKGSRLSLDWVFHGEWKAFCQQERPDLVPDQVFAQFKDYWVAKAGAGGVKLDWFATWRNWVRSQRAGAVASKDVVHTTTPTPSDAFKELNRINEDRKNFVPPSDEIRAKMKALREGVNAQKTQ